ncbi:nitroreductase [Frondihabitans sp. PhB188]|uniref:nitroreductase family protein n=1 Tax=Frondihabitans sp. PhB188 TaxID=2485200 RepID=UPI000F48E73E|nr:nitroreductase family protein [Frondihabitans sp. PhB188]ROQ38764.1 nitroreductase [Frondihabitans sp. PhB188]
MSHASATAAPVREAALRRRSRSRVNDESPTRAELLELVTAAGTVADHSGLRPWRLIELRGDDRLTVGRALAKACGARGDKADRGARRLLRAPLVIAVVSSPRSSSKVPEWEQESVTSGVAHLLSLLLDEAGWGVFWRTGSHTRDKKVAKAHKLSKNEKLLGWLYVGGSNEADRKPRKLIDAADFIGGL